MKGNDLRSDASGPSPDGGAFLSAPWRGAGRALGLAPGTRLERFRIGEHLGTGGLGDVYRARDDVRSQEVAVKLVEVGSLAADRTADQLHGENAAYGCIDDFRHVLKVYDIHIVRWGAAELLLLSMELADGGTFRQWLERHRDDWETRRREGLEFFRQICLGTAACHRAGVLHLDIKPENGLFVGGELKLSDFHTSALVQHLTGARPESHDAEWQATGPGSPAYMSPEHWTAGGPDELDSRSDVYALGVMLFEILHPKGRTPFGGGWRRLRDLHLHASPPPLRGAREAEGRVVACCLEKDPARRYGDVEELLDDLDGRLSAGAVEGAEQDGLSGLWLEACQHTDEGRFEEARALCRQVLDARPEDAEARAPHEQLQALHERAGRLYSAVEAGMGRQSLDELAALVAEAAGTWPDHPAGAAVQITLSVRAGQYRCSMEEGLAAAVRREWEASLSWFSRAAQLSPGSPDAERAAQAAREVISKLTEMRAWTDAAVREGDRPRALALARSTDQWLDGMSSVIATGMREDLP